MCTNEGVYIPPQNTKLGMKLQWSSIDKVAEFVSHVLEVSPQSPAEKAGLISYSDYVIGSPSRPLNREESFLSLLQEVFF